MENVFLIDCLAEACRLEANVINFYRKQGEPCDDPEWCRATALCTIKKCAYVDEEGLSYKDDYKGADVWVANSCECYDVMLLYYIYRYDVILLYIGMM